MFKAKSKFISVVILALISLGVVLAQKAASAQTADYTVYMPVMFSPAGNDTPAETTTEIPPTSSQLPPENFAGDMYYVSKNGNNKDGRSWNSAWNELEEVNWSVIDPGDLIWIDGGSEEMVYSTMLTIGRSGTADKPITIARAIEEGHNGKVVMFGGRANDLPYCDQSSYNDTDVLKAAIRLRGYDNIVIDGAGWSGITIHGFENGVQLDNESDNITLRNFEIYNNGTARQQNGKWYPKHRGILLAGKNVTLERMLIHDNGEDSIQSSSGENNISNFVLRESWLYNSRRHPTENEAFNYCAHSDGIQIYAGGDVVGLLIEDSIFGPGFTQNVVLGQGAKSNLSATRVSNVVFNNVVLAKAAGINVYGTHSAPGNNWTFNNVTIDCAPHTSYTGVCILISGAGHTMTNTIVMGSKNEFHDDDDHYNPFVELGDNCQYDNKKNGYGSTVTLGDSWEPQFKDVRQDPFHIGDYTQLESSPCLGRGANLTNVGMLFDVAP